MLSSKEKNSTFHTLMIRLIVCLFLRKCYHLSKKNDATYYYEFEFQLSPVFLSIPFVRFRFVYILERGFSSKALELGKFEEACINTIYSVNCSPRFQCLRKINEKKLWNEANLPPELLLLRGSRNTRR